MENYMEMDNPDSYLLLGRARKNHKFNIIYRGLCAMFVIIASSGIIYSIIHYSTSENSSSKILTEKLGISSDKNSSYTEVFDSIIKTDESFDDLIDQANLTKITTNLTTFEQQSDGCTCKGYGCGCCVTLTVPEIRLNDTGCVNFALVPRSIGISLILTIDRYVIINETISPQDVLCVAPPYVNKMLHFCIHFYDLDITNNNFHGCVQIKMKIFKVFKVKEINLGCFDLKLPSLVEEELLKKLLNAPATNTTASFSTVKPAKDWKAFEHMLSNRK